MKEVRWTETGIITLQETSDFILELWNSDVIEEFLEQLDYRIKQLQKNKRRKRRTEKVEFVS